MKYSQYDYAVIGGDLRQVYLAEHLAYHPNRIIYYALEKTPNRCTKATSLENAIRSSDCVIGPIPLCQNGSFLKQTTEENEFTLDFILNVMKPGQTFFAGCIPDIFLKETKRSHSERKHHLKGRHVRSPLVSMERDNKLTRLFCFFRHLF